MTRILALALVALCLALAACGGDDKGKPIPAATAAALQKELDNVQARIDNGSAGACRDILEGSRGPNDDRVQQIIGEMPDNVDADVRSALEDSFDRLWELVRQDCDEKASKEKPAEPETPTNTTETETDTETDTTPTETETDTTPTAPDEAPLPNDGNGNGNGGGGVPGTGNGNGGGAGVGGADEGGG